MTSPPVPDSPLTVDIGHMLAGIRRQERISQRELADAMGSAQSALSELERGITVPRVDTAVRYLVGIGRVLGRREVRAARLFGSEL